MPIEVKWLDDLKTIFCYKIIFPWSLDDVYNALDQGDMAAEQGNVPVAIVFDVKEAGMIPRSFMTVMRKLREHRSPDIQLRVFVGPNRIIRLVFDLANRAFPDLLEGIVIKETIQEAYDYIVENSTGDIGKLTADD